MEKKEILANMYALRAGLSVVAVNSEKIRTAIKAAKEKAESGEKAARRKKDEALESIRAYNAIIGENESGLAKRRESLSEARRGNAKTAVKNVFLLIGLFLGFAALAYSIGLVLASCGVFGDPPKNDFILKIYAYLFNYTAKDLPTGILISALRWVGLIVACIVVGLLIMMIVGIFRSFGVFRRGAKGMPKAKDFNDEIERCKNSVAAFKASLPRLDADIAKAKSDGRALIEQTCASLAPTARATMDLYDALKETFTPFLDERDWDNLDLLTYYVETGRADTVKESLLLLDKQKQTEQIVAAVKEASKAICRSVQKGLSYLKNDMRKCFNILSDQVGMVNSKVNAVGGAVAAQHAQIAQLASETSLNNALLAKQNENSTQLLKSANSLADDAHYIAERVRGM